MKWWPCLPAQEADSHYHHLPLLEGSLTNSIFKLVLDLDLSQKGLSFEYPAQMFGKSYVQLLKNLRI